MLLQNTLRAAQQAAAKG
ncbi:MAG: hypothetical protein OTJ97_04365 [SAR202 cluster bacterium]|nr:hypothetical protein [SAR202 cluster bacterium]